VGFTVVPGFKIGRTVIQSQVYLCAWHVMSNFLRLLPKQSNMFWLDILC
jgi:hypothetical protein